MQIQVGEMLPAKQGLKLYFSYWRPSTNLVGEMLPAKQGLKPKGQRWQIGLNQLERCFQQNKD
jgi:hypothetical protein